MQLTISRCIKLVVGMAIGTQLLACGGGTSSGLSGRIIGQSFSVPAGETRSVSGPLYVESTDSIQIDGTLNIATGASLTLVSSGDITISGTIQPTPSRSASTTRQGKGVDVQVLGKGTVKVTGVVKSPGGVIITTENGDVNVSGAVSASNGVDGTDSDTAGTNGGNIEIGSPAAIDALKTVPTVKAGVPNKITISAELKAGNGGNGFADQVGKLSGKNRTLKGSDAGNGGDINIAAKTELAVFVKLKPGNGGDGGHCGPAAGLDGVAALDRGGDVRAQAGDGGYEGKCLATAKGIEDITVTNFGIRGNPGSIDVVAGTGGPGGRGGDAFVTVGTEQPRPNIVLSPLKASSVRVTGGNGGDSNNKANPGGDGGNLAISQNFPGKVTMTAFLSKFGNGGKGFSGCGASPVVKGSNGGNGGVISSSIPLGNSPGSDILAGGDAGDGTPNEGKPGTKGTIDGKPYGSDGKAGSPCPVTGGTATATKPNNTLSQATDMGTNDSAADTLLMAGERSYFKKFLKKGFYELKINKIGDRDTITLVNPAGTELDRFSNVATFEVVNDSYWSFFCRNEPPLGDGAFKFTIRKL